MAGPPSPSPAAAMAAAEAKANVFRIRLALQPLLVHFKSSGYISDKMLDKIDFRVIKQVQGATARQEQVRLAIGRERQIWRDLSECFEAAVPSLERRSIPGPDPNQPEFDAPSGPLIAANYTSLIRDIERINDLVCICKNVLAAGDSAQDSAAKSRFDQAVFKVISVCVKVTARGYDGDAGGDEEKWQTVVNDYKRLLIGCLQLLNNLIAQNERRKLMLWVQLFDSATDSLLAPLANGDALQGAKLGENADEPAEPLRSAPEPNLTAPSNTTIAGLQRLEDLEKRLLEATRGMKDQSHSSLSKTYRDAMHKTIEDAMREGKKIAESAKTGTFLTGPFLVYIGKKALGIRQELIDNGSHYEAIDVARACEQRWRALRDDELSKWCEAYDKIAGTAASLSASAPRDSSVLALADRLQRLRTDFETVNESISQLNIDPSSLTSSSGIQNIKNLASQLPFDRTMPLEVSSYLASGEVYAPPVPSEADYRMAYSADYGADILQRGKDDLMKRLEPYVDRAQQMPGAMPQEPPIPDPALTPQLAGARKGHPILSNSSEYFSEPESEDEDYGVPGDDGRGLLTDVPLILGPNEIEILPMIILSSIVPPPTPATPGHGTTAEETTAIRNMHTVRCHFFLAQDNGRNLLRELLIFVAAWDLREDELYFKFMVKIMEAILSNGLMPFSYHAFRESKDIISPAQAVIMKLLTNIFRLRQNRFQRQQQGEKVDPLVEHMPHYPARVDVHLVNFLLTEFRRHIIPQTCALIFLQGQIRQGLASPEDFPLNLWDMERMYEGIYQYLEFFAILTECDAWKQMMAEWDITCELVTLLKELDAAIPRSILAREMNRIPGAPRHPASSVLPPLQQQPPPSVDDQEAQPVAVERPYDPVSPLGPHAPESTLSFTQPTTSSNKATAGPQDDEPSEFPWKNLKKLTVLVLSSLTWKSQRVQNQVRDHGGMDVILNCTKHDDFNPYIREHAIIALRFLVEGNDRNREVVRYLEAKAAESARAKSALTLGAAGNAIAARRRRASATLNDGRVPVGGGDAVAIASAIQEAVPRVTETYEGPVHLSRLQNRDHEAFQAGEHKSTAGSLGEGQAGFAGSLPKDGGAASTGLFNLMKEVMREMPARVRGQALDRQTELLRQLDKEFD